MPPLSKCLRLVAVVLSLSASTVWGQTNRLVVTGRTSGVNTATGQRPVRQNVNTLSASAGPQWDLFILGLQAFQAASESDQLSYFGIAGIHGRPYIPFNGVNAVPGGSGGGYCPHGEIMFPAWHRPYVSAYEQVLGTYVTKIAAQYTGNNAATYQTAAEQWRMPYWDWAADPHLPASASTATITVNGPTGQTTINNPLYSYKWQKFPLNHANNYFPTNTDYNCWGWPETTRQPNRQGVDQLAIVNQQLSTDPSPLKDQVYLVMSSVKDFNTMASSGTAGTSFEDPHNDVHNSMYAIMSSLDYSAFDPIFWLHHTQVDRLVALWQAINYNNTVMTGSYQTNGLFATAAGARITADTDLKPFYRDANNFHTGRTAATTKNFGYSYPEISNDWSVSPAQLRTSVIRAVNILYGDGSLAGNPVSSSPSSATATSVQPTSTPVQQQAATSQAPVTPSQQPTPAAPAPPAQPTTSAVNAGSGSGGGGNGGGWSWSWPWGWGGWNVLQQGPPSAPPPAKAAAPPAAKGWAREPPAAKGGPQGKRGKRSSSGGAIAGGHGRLHRRHGCAKKDVIESAPSPVNNAAAGYGEATTYPTESPAVNTSVQSTADVNATTPAKANVTTTLYALAVQVERSDLPLPCSIIFALGSQTAGQMTVLSMPATGLTHSQIPLKRAVDKLGLTDEIAHDDGPTAIAKLTSILQATIRMANGTIVSNPKVPSLKITVQAQDVVQAASIDHFPIYKEPLKGPTLTTDNNTSPHGADIIALQLPAGVNLTATTSRVSASSAGAAAALNGTMA
ncbi:Di-copper centre-containing [Apiospora rasikravindrae]|uniref:tyrosinase n=1 Tax=Apiospora rasikravindrae TaxID=990691 RepID=A0ABR1UAY0_9PEZI